VDKSIIERGEDSGNAEDKLTLTGLQAKSNVFCKLVLLQLKRHKVSKIPLAEQSVNAQQDNTQVKYEILYKL
jgi:hypothetical protein